MSSALSSEAVQAALLRAIQEQTAKAIDEEIEASKTRLEQRIRERCAEIAMSIMKTYDVTVGHDRILISVRTEKL